jgi:transcriptional regulator with XRE-family HTH domain
MAQELKSTLKERLRLALLEADMKPIELSERTGIPKSMISYYLNGKTKPKADRIYIISKELGVSEAWLLGYDVPKNRTAEQKKNDDLVQVIAKLRKDPEFFEVVSKLASLPPAEYASIKQILSALGNK